MAKYLPEFGWEPIVYTPDNSRFMIKDDSLVTDEAKNIAVLRKPIWDPGTWFGRQGKAPLGEVRARKSSLLFRLAVWVRANVFIPDSKIFWVKPSLRFLSKYFNRRPPDMVVTTGPPHSMHLIGLGLKNILGVKWLADFRDPWSAADIMAQLAVSGFALSQHVKMEKNVLRQADVVVTIGKRLGDSFTALEPGCNLRIVTNGFDEQDFAGEGPTLPDDFVITYTGILYPNRNPEQLWEVLNEMCHREAGFAARLRVNIAGFVDEAVRSGLEQYNELSGRVNFTGYLSHGEAIELCRQSALLVLPVDNTKNSRMIVPGKMFEYLAARVPIISFGPSDSDANDILLASGHRPVIAYDDKNKIYEEVKFHYTNFLQGEATAGYTFAAYSRRALAKEISEIMHETVG